MPQLKLYLFGAPRVTINDKPVSIPRRKVMAALLYTFMARKSLQRDALAALLWPEAERKSARSSLRRELHALNTAIGPEWLDVSRNDVMLNPAADVWCDVDAFRSYLAAVKNGKIKNATDSGPGTPENSVQPLTDAVALYQGDFLTGFTLSDCPAFDDWQFFESEELRQEYKGALVHLTQHMKSQQNYDSALDYARRVLILDTLDEPAHRELMELYALAGHQSAALRQYDECTRILDDELGVPPEEETVALAEAIRSRQFPSAQAAANQSSTAASKVKTSPKSAHHDGATIPTPQTPHEAILPPRSLPHKLPTLTTSFIGREEELDAIERLLIAEPECRLLTLVGPGGIGKTRLALAAAQRLVDYTQRDEPLDSEHTIPFEDGIYFVSLAMLKMGDSILSSLTDTLSLPIQSGTDLQTQLLNYLQSKQILLVMDNVEHLLDQADLLLELLNHAPGLVLLVTSREAITLQEEWLYAITGFLPPDDGNQQNPESNSAIALFVQRARRADSSLTLTDDAYHHIGRICRLVDGMPLGIELAATWIRVLSLEEIADEIESNLDFLATTKHSVLDRHSSMRTVLDQTWQLLSSTEQDAFCKLSIFQGGFTRQAASRVIGTSTMILAALVRKSIVSHNRDGRYAIHGLLRQFAVTKLNIDEVAAQEVAEKHCRYYGTYLQTLEDDLAGSAHADALEKISTELDNIRSGWRWAISQLDDNTGAATVANTYVAALFQFYETRSRFQEGAAEFEFAIERLSNDGREHTKSQVPNGAALQESAGLLRASLEERQLLIGRVSGRLGWLLFQIGQPELAKTHLADSVDLLLALDAQKERIFSLNYLGAVYRHLGDYEDAIAILEESRQLCTETNDRFGLTIALNILGQITYERRSFGDAEAYLEESLGIKRAIGDRRGTTFSLLYLGLIAKEQEDYAKAMRLFRESMLISEEHGDRRGIAIGLSNLGDVEIAVNHPERARNAYEEALAAYIDIYNLLGIVTTHIKLGELIEREDDDATVKENAVKEHYSAALRYANNLQLSSESLDELIRKPREWLAHYDVG